MAKAQQKRNNEWENPNVHFQMKKQFLVVLLLYACLLFFKN